MNRTRKLALAAFTIATATALAAPALAGEPRPACSGPTCSGECADVVDAAAQERLGELVTRQRDELVSLTRTLVAERKRQAELESELAVARVAVAQTKPAPAAAAVVSGDAAVAQEENRRLRVLLDLQRQENDKLTSKLRTAEKVTDLVFRAEDESAPAGRAEGQEQAAAPALPRWIAPRDASPEDSTVWTREIDKYHQPDGPTPEKSTVWTREAMGY